MRHFHLKKNPLFHPVINIDRLWTLVTEGTKAKYAASKDKAAVIDVTKAGFHKVSVYLYPTRFLEKEDFPTNP